MLDIGCGPGAQTVSLAKALDCDVVAVDIHQPFLDEVGKRASEAGLAKRIKALAVSMDDLPFEEESFDLIWFAYGYVFYVARASD